MAGPIITISPGNGVAEPVIMNFACLINKVSVYNTVIFIWTELLITMAATSFSGGGGGGSGGKDTSLWHAVSNSRSEAGKEIFLFISQLKLL